MLARRRPHEVVRSQTAPADDKRISTVAILRAIGHSIPRLPSRWRRRSKPLARVIWEHFKAQPGFREEQRQALRDLREGRSVPLREVPRDG